MRIINAPLQIAYNALDSANESLFKSEFDRMSENNNDPIAAWIRTTRARGKVVDENEPILQLLIELHRKIDSLSAQINNESKSYITLDSSATLKFIGHHLLIFGEDLLNAGAKYYARLDIAVFPTRKIPLFFNALDSKTAEIYLMHGRDEVDFDSYITARERSLIRERKKQS